MQNAIETGKKRLENLVNQRCIMIGIGNGGAQAVTTGTVKVDGFGDYFWDEQIMRTALFHSDGNNIYLDTPVNRALMERLIKK